MNNDQGHDTIGRLTVLREDIRAILKTSLEDRLKLASIEIILLEDEATRVR